MQLVLFRSMQRVELRGMSFRGIPQILGKLESQSKRKRQNRAKRGRCSVGSCCGRWERVSLEPLLCTPQSGCAVRGGGITI